MPVPPKKLDARAAAAIVAERLKKSQPHLGWQFEIDAATPALRIGDRLFATFEDSAAGVLARMSEPGQPGDDDPPVLLSASHEVNDFAWDVEIKASHLGTISMHALRRNAVYVVTREFADFDGKVFPVGTRLTYVGQNFCAYHGGYTIQFDEAIISLDAGDQVCSRFGDYVALESGSPAGNAAVPAHYEIATSGELTTIEVELRDGQREQVTVLKGFEEMARAAFAKHARLCQSKSGGPAPE